MHGLFQCLPFDYGTGLRVRESLAYKEGCVCSLWGCGGLSGVALVLPNQRAKVG